MAPTTTSRPARKRTAARPKPPTADAEPLAFEPIRIVPNEEVPDERVPLFYIGEEEYTVPARLPAGMALEYLRVAREHGVDSAASALLTRALGEKAYMALESSRGLTEEQLDRIVQTVVDLAMGRVKREGKAARS